MKKTVITLYLCAFPFILLSEETSEEPVCHKCKIIREENKKKVNLYKYYEDYAKDHSKENKNESKNIQEKKDANF